MDTNNKIEAVFMPIAGEVMAHSLLLHNMIAFSVAREADASRAVDEYIRKLIAAMHAAPQGHLIEQKINGFAEAALLKLAETVKQGLRVAATQAASLASPKS